MLTYGTDLFSAKPGSLSGMNSFWPSVQRGMINTFISTTTNILSWEACLPPVSYYCIYKGCLAALRIGCAPSTSHLAAARLPAAFQSLLACTALDSSRNLTCAFSLGHIALD